MIKELFNKAKMRRLMGKGGSEFATWPKERKVYNVARDVLLQLNMGNFKSTNGTYVAVQGGKSCHVCAIGGTFVATAMNCGLDISSEMQMDSDEMIELMAGVFSRDELRLMEVGFEAWDDRCDAGEYGLTRKGAEALYKFIHAHQSGDSEDWVLGKNGSYSPQMVNGRKMTWGEHRLRLIMVNLLENCGKFTPEKLPSKYTEYVEPEAVTAYYKDIAKAKPIGDYFQKMSDVFKGFAAK